MSEQSRIRVTDRSELIEVHFTDSKIVDSANIEEMGEEMFALVDQQRRKHVLLNFDGVEFLSSAALNKLILMEKKIKTVGGTLRLCNLRAEILEVFKITRLDRMFDIRATEAEALKAFGIS